MKLEIKNIKIKFEDKIVLQKTNINFYSKQIATIIGESGAGKTSLLNTIGLLSKNAYSSNFYIDGQKLNTKTEKELDKNRKNLFSYVSQQDTLINNITVWENINVNYQFKNNEAVNNEKLDKILTELNIIDLKNKKVDSLSGGERQRVVLARAIAVDSKIILCDEPTSGLDGKNRDFVINILRKIAYEQNKIVIIVTHDMQIANIGDNVYQIVNQKINTLRQSKDSNDNEEKIKINNDNKTKFSFYNWYSKITAKKNKIPSFIKTILVLVIAFVTVFNNLGKNYIEQQKAIIQGGLNTKILVQKVNKPSQFYDIFAEPINQTEVNLLKNNNENSIQPYYEFSQFDYTTPSSSFNNNQNKTKQDGPEDGIYIKKDSEIFNFKTRGGGQFFNLVPYEKSDFPNEDIQEGTVLISNAFEEKIRMSENDKFAIGAFVPVGITITPNLGTSSFLTLQNSIFFEKTDLIFGKFIDTTKVKAPAQFIQNSIFIPKNIMDNILSENITNFKSQENGTDKKTISDFEYNAYLINVSDVSQIDPTISKLSRTLPNMSFYSWGNNLVESINAFNNFAQGTKIASIILIAIMILLFGSVFYFKVIRRKREVGILKLFGLSKKDILKIIYLDLFKQMIKVYIYSLITINILIYIINYISAQEGFKAINFEYIMLIIPMIIIVISVIFATIIGIYKVLKTSPEEILNENR